MARSRHPNKDIEKAVKYAEENGWTLIKGAGHCWGKLRCPQNKGCRGGIYCSSSIWSTPKVPEDLARKIRRAVDGCEEESKDEDV